MRIILPFEARFMELEDLALEVKFRLKFLDEMGTVDKDGIATHPDLEKSLAVYIDYREGTPVYGAIVKVEEHQLQSKEIVSALFHDIAPWGLVDTSYENVPNSEDVGVTIKGMAHSLAVDTSRDYFVWNFCEVGLAELAMGKGV